MFPRLLRVTDEYYQPEIAVESKGYITVRVGKSQKATHVYWQLVDPVFSLLQLGFEWPSGRLVHCSVPLFKGDVEILDADPAPGGTVGTPFFDLSKWPVRVTEGKDVSGNVIEESGQIRLQRSRNALSILARESTRQRSVVYGGTVVCDFDPYDELAALTLLGSFPS
jgi:hypothetical protein